MQNHIRNIPSPAEADLRLVAEAAIMARLSETRWSEPVIIRFQSGLSRLFSAVEEALDFLENEWPIRRGKRFDVAVSHCQAATAGKTNPEQARQAFIAAAYEAGFSRIDRLAA